MRRRPEKRLFMLLQTDGDSLGNGGDMMLSVSVTPSKMEDTHQTYMDMFAGSESDIDASQDDVDNSSV